MTDNRIERIKKIGGKYPNCFPSNVGRFYASQDCHNCCDRVLCKPIADALYEPEKVVCPHGEDYDGTLCIECGEKCAARRHPQEVPTDELLTDEELQIACGWEDISGIDDYERDIAKAQLAKCSQLYDALLIADKSTGDALDKAREAAIRADERKKLGRWLENETRGVNFGAWAYWWNSLIAKLQKGEEVK